MRRRDKVATGIVTALLVAAAGVAVGQEGPNKDPNATVARPRKKGVDTENAPPEPDQQKIPSKYSKKDKHETEGLTNFKADIDLVTVDVAVLDNKGHFIPGIPKGNFRILEDNVPQ